jgi:hypothetical protein
MTSAPTVWPIFSRSITLVQIGALNRSEAAQLIREPVAKYYPFTDEAVEFILTHSRAMPAEVQRLAHSAVRVMLEQEGTRVTQAHAERALRQVR